ncbi:PCFT protein, partial [Amia calva]|nr:PCFT protein [Amia calva]
QVCKELYEEDICGHLQSNKEHNEIQKQASYILLLFTAVMSFVSIPPAMLLGSWSDRAGRKFGMILPSVASIAAGAVLIVIAEVENINIYWTVAASILIGLSGGYVSMILSCFSYLADDTESSNRTLRMAIVESMIFIGGTVGFLLSGFLVQYFSFTPTFGVFCSCHVLSMLYVLLLLRNPESSVEGRGILSGDEATRSVWSYARLTCRAVFRKRPGQDRQKLHFLLLCTFLNNVIVVGEQAILLLFLTYPPRQFNSQLYGVFNATRMLLLGFFLMGLFPLLMRYIGEMTLAKVGSILRMVSFLLLAFSTNTWMVFLCKQF